MNAPAAPSPPVIRVEDGTPDNTSTQGFMAVFFLLAAGLAIWRFKVPWNFDFDSRDFNPLVLVPVVLGAIGLRFLVPYLLGRLRGKKFGLSVLEIQGEKVERGGRMRGRVVTDTELKPTGDYELRLQCIETYEVRSTQSESINKCIEHVSWEAVQQVPATTVRSKQGIPFEFTVPERIEPSPPKASGSALTQHLVISTVLRGKQEIIAQNVKPVATRWLLIIQAPLQGIGYRAAFTVPIAV